MLKCFGAQTTRRTPHQIVMLGLEGSGKTTLLYKLKVPGWTEMSRDMQKAKEKDRHWDVGYHYEEFQNGRLKWYGIWDVPGSDEMIPLWNLFYRYIVVSAVIFVVDAAPGQDEAMEQVQKARRWLHFLLNEDEIRSAAFIVIVNERWHRDDIKKKRRRKKKKNGHHGSSSEKEEFAHEAEEGGILNKGRDPTRPWTQVGKAFLGKLNVADIMEQPWNKDRFRIFFMDCSDPVREWKEVIEEIYKIYIKVGPGRDQS